MLWRGGVAKWSKAEVCKTSIHRFKSDRRLFGKANGKLLVFAYCSLLLIAGVAE